MATDVRLAVQAALRVPLFKQTPLHRRPCESRDPYAVPYREDTAYGSRRYGRDDKNVGAPYPIALRICSVRRPASAIRKPMSVWVVTKRTPFRMKPT